MSKPLLMKGTKSRIGLQEQIKEILEEGIVTNYEKGAIEYQKQENELITIDTLNDEHIKFGTQNSKEIYLNHSQ